MLDKSRYIVDGKVKRDRTKNKLYFTIEFKEAFWTAYYDKKTKQHECMIEPYHAS